MSDRDRWRVAVPVPLRRLFVYEVPPRLGEARPGCRVLVPFGPRRLAGYLVERVPEQERLEHRLRDAEELLDSRPAIPGELLEILMEAAAYYAHPPGEVLRSALPPGIDPGQRGGKMRPPRVKARRFRVVLALDGAARAAVEIDRRAPRRAAVLRSVAQAGELPERELRGAHPRLRQHLDRLEKDGLIAIEERDRPPDPFLGPVVDRLDPPRLTDEQREALGPIESRLDEGGYRGFLLHGITGSGKTEVYLRAVERARDLGRGALVLVPEISLTPQLVRRYRERLGDDLAVWHSALSERERYDQWQLLRAGSVRAAIGVRSAVFAPVERLGLIVVDEEHDGSFKQDRGFAYNARDVALLRAARAGAVAVLGSATPALETFRNSVPELGKLSRLELRQRPTAQPLPEVEVVDLRRHRSGPGGQRLISAPLHEAISLTLERGEQAILFLNRRGFAPSLICAACGDVQRCDDCAVSLTLHRRPPGLVCHYCGARRPLPRRCPSCGGEDLRSAGIGTQQAEQVLGELFPRARIARLDRDVASGRGAEALLERLRAGEIDILVGTQMVTKGHDFPRVTLVGVLLADVGLHMPDFRAAERAFQLMTQVAGRAGRSELGGRAIIQTFSPEHPAVVLARNHDYTGFAERELATRRELGYPPFGRLCAIRLSGTDVARVEDAARRLRVELDEARGAGGSSKVEILGPAPAPISMLQGRHRFRILLRAPRQDWIRSLLSAAGEALESPPAGVRVRIDVDPVSML
jgi:primosomal protein N' (replication factor Y) (superfamily II helicase)